MKHSRMICRLWVVAAFALGQSDAAAGPRPLMKDFIGINGHTVQFKPELVDVLTVHSYAQLTNWPTWKRSFPEDPALPEWRGKSSRARSKSW